VKTLKERIQNLEDVKKVLQQELAAVQYKMKAIEDDVKKLTKSRESENAKSAKLEGESKKIQYTLNEVKEDLAVTKTDNEKLKNQFRHQSGYVAGVPALLPVQASEETIVMSHLGEMCWQIQAAMYKKILPQHFTAPIRSYKIKAFEKDTKKLSKSEENKQQASKRWEAIRTLVRTWNLDALKIHEYISIK
jgi:septal ring factor EnvC (AmiA/AmiB activator)